MRFSTQALLAALVSPLLALAAGNSFNVPSGGYNVTAGQSTQLSWTATTSGTISLILRSGASSDLIAGTYIAQNITNSGSYTWNVASTITRGSDYTVEIVDDTDNSDVNFTPYFVIESTNTVASSTSDIALGAATTASVSSVATSAAALTGTTTNGGTSVSSAISSANSALSSARSSVSSEVSSASSAASKSASSATGSASSGSTASASAASTTASGSGAAPTLLPAAGFMGLMALGAFAL